MRHVIKTGGDNRVLATFSDGQPALVQVPNQKGSLYYLGIPLVADSLIELLDRILAGCGAQSPIRFLGPNSEHVRRLEYRAVRSGDGWLAFVNNLDPKHDCQVQLATDLKFGCIRNLTLESDLSPRFTVPAGETYILKLQNR